MRKNSCIEAPGETCAGQKILFIFNVALEVCNKENHSKIYSEEHVKIKHKLVFIFGE